MISGDKEHVQPIGSFREINVITPRELIEKMDNRDNPAKEIEKFLELLSNSELDSDFSVFFKFILKLELL